MSAKLSIGLQVFGFLLACSLTANAQPYIVTDLKGAPRYSGGFLHLLTKVENETEIELKEGESVTLTCLTDASRATLTGPLKATLRGHRLQGKDVFLEKGRKESVENIRQVSSTLGARAVRDSVGDSFLYSRGKILRPVLSWSENRNYPFHKVVLSRGGEFVKEWPSVKGSELWLENLELDRGVTYTVTLTPLKPGPLGSALTGRPSQADFELVSEERLRQVAEVEDRFRVEFLEAPSDLTPLTLYLAYLGEQEFFYDALRLLEEPSFKKVEYEATRNRLRRLLAPDPRSGG